jgi:hypothetical protein
MNQNKNSRVTKQQVGNDMKGTDYGVYFKEPILEFASKSRGETKKNTGQKSCSSIKT